VAVALVGLALAALASATAGGAAPAEYPDGLAFDIVRKGAVIGHHVARFRRDGSRLTVDTEIRILVRFAAIPVFRYEYDGREVWQDGRLIALDTRTNDDGEAFRVSVRRDADHLVVDGNAGRLTLPADTMPTSYWHRGLMAAAGAIDSQRGRLAELHITPPAADPVELDGKPVAAQRYEVTGDLNLTIWYLPSGEWVQLAFHAKGSDITYVRRPAGPIAGAKP
jgi:hypothetical protein